MRRYLAVALLVAGVSFPACAQRGGAHGGFSGHSAAGFSGHSAADFSGRSVAGFSARGAGGFRSFAPPNRYSGGSLGANPGFGVPSAVRLARPSFYSRRPARPGYPYRPYRPGLGLGFAYGYPGWITPDSLSYCDPDFEDCYGLQGYYGNPAYDDEAGYYGDQGGDQGYDGEAGYEGDQGYDGNQGYVGQVGVAPPSGYASQDEIAQQPPYAAQYPQPYAQPDQQQLAATERLAAIPAPPADEDAVTLIFKDGRPPEQIRNYALTRTTLYVIRAGRRHDIPVAELDLAATEKANRAAGVDFRLPQTANRPAQ